MSGAFASTQMVGQLKRDGAFFPAPSECIAACEKAKRARTGDAWPHDADRRQAASGFNPDRHKLALDLLGSELGIEALKARWHGALYDFIYRNTRMPKGTEIDAVKRVARVLRCCEGVRARRNGRAVAQSRALW